MSATPANPAPPVSFELFQAAAVALDLWAIGGEKGRSKDDPVYEAVTEGRDRGAMRARYSSCGDRAHWKLFRLGVRAPWVNRAEHKGWRVGANISAIASACGAPYAAWVPIPGDELLVWNTPQGFDAHSLSILEVKGDTFVTANYGAGGMSAAAWPGARRGEAVWKRNGSVWHYGAKRIQRVLRLAEIHRLAVAWCDIPAGVALTGEVIDVVSGKAPEVKG